MEILVYYAFTTRDGGMWLSIVAVAPFFWTRYFLEAANFTEASLAADTGAREATRDDVTFVFACMPEG